MPIEMLLNVHPGNESELAIETNLRSAWSAGNRGKVAMTPSKSRNAAQDQARNSEFLEDSVGTQTCWHCGGHVQAKKKLITMTHSGKVNQRQSQTWPYRRE